MSDNKFDDLFNQFFGNNRKGKNQDNKDESTPNGDNGNKGWPHLPKGMKGQIFRRDINELNEGDFNMDDFEEVTDFNELPPEVRGMINKINDMISRGEDPREIMNGLYGDGEIGNINEDGSMIRFSVNGMGPEEFFNRNKKRVMSLEKELDIAIEDEDYEYAASLRDKIAARDAGEDVKLKLSELKVKMTTALQNDDYETVKTLLKEINEIKQKKV